MATKYYCDRCGKELDDEFMEMNEARLQYVDKEDSLSHYRFADHSDSIHLLCLDCYNDYIDFLNGTFTSLISKSPVL